MVKCMIQLNKFSLKLTADSMRRVHSIRREVLLEIISAYNSYNRRSINKHPIPLVNIMRSIKMNIYADAIIIGIREDSPVYKELERLEYCTDGINEIRVVRVALENIFSRWR